LETETMDVARLRREAPGRAAEEWKIRTGVEIEEDDRRRAEGVKGVVGGGGGVVVDGGMGIGGESEMGMERWEDVKGMYGRGCEGLVGLVGKGGMTETAARCERAVRVGEVVEGG